MSMKEDIFINNDGTLNKKNLTILLEKYLDSKWLSKPNDLWDFNRLSGGYSNTIVKVQNLFTNKNFLIRLFGNSLSSPDDINRKNLIGIFLGEINMGPKLYGVFPKGTIEEFLPGRNLTRKELHLEAITKQIGYHMGLIHKLELPLIKKPTFFDDVENWLCKIENGEEMILKKYKNYSNDELSKILGFQVEKVNDNNKSFLKIFVKQTMFISSKPIPKYITTKELRNEFYSILELMTKSQSPVVFCHNDIHEGNILYDESNITILPIDYEYACYNYRAFDFSQTLNHYIWEYGEQNKLGYNIFIDEYPNKNLLEAFFCDYKKSSCTSSNIDALIEESFIFQAIPHFVWSLWGLEKQMTSINDIHNNLCHASSSFDRLSLYYHFKI
uniref:CHK domain-containing protein n=1 Tax=Parastrongyloides trichosuri TaxID=131310 RepID=A0A0N4ZGA2_PARTI